MSLSINYVGEVPRNLSPPLRPDGFSDSSIITPQGRVLSVLAPSFLHLSPLSTPMPILLAALLLHPPCLCVLALINLHTRCMPQPYLSAKNMVVDNLLGH